MRIHTIRILTTAVLAMMLGATTYGQRIALSADTIALGDQTTLSISDALRYPSADALSQGGIEALRQDYDTATRTQTTLLTSFEPGEHWLHIGDDSLLIVVEDVEIDTASAELRDIAPIERVPYTFWEIFRWVLLALAVGGVAFGLWWILSHRKEMKQVLGMAEPADTRTPYERARQGLEELRGQHLWQAGKTKEYHTILTDIVRRFIEESTGIRATDMTSDETVEAVKNGEWRVDSTRLRRLFATADLVKFAKSEPLPDEHEASMTMALAFVDELWLQVKPQEDGEEVHYE